MSKIFLSHSSKDKAFARRLGVDLRRHGHTVWIDEAEILVGDSLIEKIREGIDRVDFVVAVLSKNSITSPWVKRELDVASNREIAEKRVIVLPVLLEAVDLPGFLKGKRYADFRRASGYDDALDHILTRLGPARPFPISSQSELDRLRAEVATAKAAANAHSRELKRHRRLVSLRRSPKLESEIRKENAQNPEYAAINDSYAFDIDGISVTLGYVLWSLAKAERRGSPTPLDMLVQMNNRWDDVKLMLEAYSDYLGQRRKSQRARRASERKRKHGC